MELIKFSPRKDITLDAVLLDTITSDECAWIKEIRLIYCQNRLVKETTIKYAPLEYYDPESNETSISVEPSNITIEILSDYCIISDADVLFTE